MAALIDSEKTDATATLDAQREQFVKNCAAAGIRCHVLERRAFENYLTERAIRAVKGEGYRSLGAFEKLKDAKPTWGKSENWRIAREMTRTELDGTDLGDFLQSL